jgi:site-specific DNA recombinase
MMTEVGLKERAVLYARISLDKTGEQIGVQRQLHDLRKLAEARDWEVVEEAVDNDISASKGLERPGYLRVWELVRADAVDHVLVWQSSRLVRSRDDRAAVISTFGTHNVDIVAYKGPSLDLRTAYGRGMADSMTNFDTMESEVKSERVTAAIADLARRGKSWGYCPYGWDRTGKGVHARQTINDHEAAVVRELVDRFLAGESLNELQRVMNERSEPSPGWAVWMKQPSEVREHRAELKNRKPPTKVWAKSTVRALLLRDANAGIRRYGDAELSGDWPPITDRARHDRVVALLSSPERRSHAGRRPGARRHLLTRGIGECGKCGADLRVWRRSGKRGNGDKVYLCNTPKHCTGRLQEKVDDLVAEVVIARMQKPDALDWLMGDDERARELTRRCEELQRKIDEAADAFTGTGSVDVERVRERIVSQLVPQLEAARRERDAALREVNVDELRKLAGPKAAERWEEMTVTERRAVLQTIGLKAVVLKPRTKHGPGFERETVDFVWKKKSGSG